MALASLVSRSTMPYLSSVLTCCSKSTSSPKPKMNLKKHNLVISRRVGTIATAASLLLVADVISSNQTACGFDFRMTVPDQTVEEAESMIKAHAQALLDVKSLIQEESWREARRELRKNSAYLKQDIYTIIQSKEGSVRPLLRKLYSNLFNNVTKLDFAARDEDAAKVWDCYNNVAAALRDILSRI